MDLDTKEHGDLDFCKNLYDEDKEALSYARSLLDDKELDLLKKEIAAGGFLTIRQARELINDYTTFSGDVFSIDPELMLAIDTRINYRLFITKDNVFTHEELLKAYPFHDLGQTPENVFVQQEVGVFPPNKGDDQIRLLARDRGSVAPFLLMGEQRQLVESQPSKITLTKIFLGRDRWEDFVFTHRFARCFQTFFAPQLQLKASEDLPPVLSFLLGAPKNSAISYETSGGS